MLAKSVKIGVLLVTLLILALFFITNTKIVCSNEYWENAKTQKQIENIEICRQEGNVDAAVLLSKMYANGDIVEKNHLKAIEIVKELAKSGNSNAMIQVADLYSCYNKYNDYDKAEELYKKAINSGGDYSEKAKIELARFYMRKYYNTKESKYIDLYIDWLKKIAHEGNIDAMHLLASEYKEGQYLNKDYYASLYWLKIAAARDDVYAYRTIGNYYANGFLGEVDDKEAKYWFQEAVNRGDSVAADFLNSNPSPLDLELTIATVSDFKKKFKKYKKLDNPNFINGGETYIVKQEYIALDGLKDDVVFVFDKNSILDSVLIVFDKSKCYDVQSHLKSKYRPIVEGSQTFFTQGLTQIKFMDSYVFYSPLNTTTQDLGVCTLLYQSRVFSIKLFERDQFLSNKYENAKKQKINSL